jgi:UDP-N-acetylmuramate dehydrogenase
MLELQQDISLSEYTTIKLGGNARYFVACRDETAIREALRFSREKALPVQVLGGGSNIIFLDEGFDGVVLKVDLRGIEIEERGDNDVFVTAKAGENWDEFVQFCVKSGLMGVESLSGIPGSVGATPIQNVGAYGYEMSDIIDSVTAIHRERLAVVEFSAEECEFGYRKSRFKGSDRDKFIITEVTYRLVRDKSPEIRYKALEERIRSSGKDITAQNIRDNVLKIRREKSMVYDPADPNACSVGSFFVNPILSMAEFEEFKRRCQQFFRNEIHLSIPFYLIEDRYKIPAAWLIEKSGFGKGFCQGNVGISSKHCLALINCGGTTTELLELANAIQEKVYINFGIQLKREAVVVG